MLYMIYVLQKSPGRGVTSTKKNDYKLVTMILSPYLMWEIHIDHNQVWLNMNQ